MKSARFFALLCLAVLAVSSTRAAQAISPGAPPAQSGSLEASTGTMPAGAFVHVNMSDEPPLLSEAELARLEKYQASHPWPAASPLPDGDTAVRRSDSETDPRTATGPQSSVTPQQPNTPSAPGTFTLFRDVSFGATIKANTSGLTGEPNVANSGPIVFATGNWWAAVSANGGQSFKFVNPFTMFPASYGGFCCDQTAVYDPSRDIFIWTLQYISSGAAGMGKNIFRVAVARPLDALEGNWYSYDFTSATNTEYDFPDLCLSNDFAYYFTNRGVFNSGSVNDSFVFRLPLDPLSTGAGFGFSFVDFAANGISNLSWHCARGATDVVYFAAHNTTSQIRIFRWPENSGSLSSDNVNLSAAWFNSTHTCPTPDGKDWCGFDDGRIKAGWVSRGMIGFLWGSAAGGSFAVSYVDGVRVVESTRAYLDRPFIWNSSLAFQYPAAAPNARGDVGILVHTSSSTVEPGYYVGIDDDYSRDAGFGPPGWEVKFVRQGTQGPNTNRWGDYHSVQSFLPNGLGWIGAGHSMQGCGAAGCKETRYDIFGRERDLRGIQNYMNPIFGLALPIIHH